jgi:hypothetical protein
MGHEKFSLPPIIEADDDFEVPAKKGIKKPKQHDIEVSLDDYAEENDDDLE